MRVRRQSPPGRDAGSLAILRELGDRSGRADAVASLGRVALAHGDLTSARLRYLESLDLRRELGQRLAMPAMLEDLAGLAAAQGWHGRALTLAGAAAVRDTLGAPRSPADQEQVEHWFSATREALGGEAAAQAWAEGQARDPLG